jgi:hypothetical protein
VGPETPRIALEFSNPELRHGALERERAQLGPGAAAVGRSLAALVLSAHASHPAHFRLLTPAAVRDLPQLLSPSIVRASLDHRIL